MTFLVYIVLYACSICLAASASKSSMKMGNNVWNYPSFYGLLVVFSFIVGTRYMVGVDYSEYMQIVQWGDHHHYYEQIEFIPRKIVDLVNALNLEFYWWFILMSFLQIFFIARAARGPLVRVFPWTIFVFLVLYLSFYMNVVRQGAALSCFLCAVTYAQERKLWPYLLFFSLGFLCHSSIIVWLPTYWILNRELFPNIKVQYLLLIASAFVLPSVIERLIDATRPYWELFGYGYQAENYEGNETDIVLGSGMGIMFRYLRWFIIIGYYNRMKNCYGSSFFLMFYNLFFVGVCFDASTMLNILLTRVFMYGGFMEIVVLALLLNYLYKSRKSVDQAAFVLLLILLLAPLFYSILSGSLEWRFVWDRFTI